MLKKDTLLYNNTAIPLRIKIERRNSIRFSISKKSANALLPRHLSAPALADEIVRFKKWTTKQLQRDPGLLNRFVQKIYQTDDVVKIMDKDFVVKLLYAPRKTLGGSITKNHELLLELPKSFETDPDHTIISTLVSRVFSNFFLERIKSRVHHYNDQYFQEVISQIRLKNNQSNWGSCSTMNNINLSSRLLFAPRDVRDYVIVHELAHLKEMNHSKRFWKIVADVMPDYLDKEDWLKKHGHALQF